MFGELFKDTKPTGWMSTSDGGHTEKKTNNLFNLYGDFYNISCVCYASRQGREEKGTANGMQRFHRGEVWFFTF